MSEGENEFVTSGGVVLKISPVSQLLIDKVRAGVKMPTRPMYAETINLPGAAPVVRHYQMLKADDAGTPEEKEAWAKYEVEYSDALRLQTQRMLEAILLPGAGLNLELPTDDTWVRVQTYLGVEVPEDEIARKVHYLLTQVLVTADDLKGLIIQIMRSSRIDEEAIRAAEDSFRHSLRKPGGTEPIQSGD